MSRTAARWAYLLLLSAAALAGPAAGQEASGSKPVAPARPHWSYQPVQNPPLPEVNQTNWVRGPIDAFVLRAIEAKALTPSADADRAAFIRRATLDVWGVIPTPEEVSAFVKDAAPDAYEKLVDRLLASPRYGERQAGAGWILRATPTARDFRAMKRAPTSIAIAIM